MSQRLLQLTPDEQRKVDKLRRSHDANNLDDEWRFIGTFGYYFGYEGVRAIRNNEITLDEAEAMLIAARKTWNRSIVDIANATYTAQAASQSKKGKSIMKKGLRDYMRNS